MEQYNKVRELNSSVNSSMAILFYDQCMGKHNGHMSQIPNNPILHSICLANGVNDVESFRDFLIDVANNLPNTVKHVG